MAVMMGVLDGLMSARFDVIPFLDGMHSAEPRYDAILDVSDAKDGARLTAVVEGRRPSLDPCALAGTHVTLRNSLLQTTPAQMEHFRSSPGRKALM